MRFVITDIPRESDINGIENNLKKYNCSNLGIKAAKPLAIFVKNKNNNKIGGIIAQINGNWLEMSLLWVDEKFRGRKIGSKLLKTLEAEAIVRGCKYAFLDTFSLKAREFYLKLGYKEVLKLDEYPATSKRYYLLKQLIENK